MSVENQNEWPSTYGRGADGTDGEEGTNHEFIQPKDVILFIIEATESMLASNSVGSPSDEDTQSCSLLESIKVAYHLMRKKIISNPKDRIGLMVFNTEEGSKTGSNSWQSCIFLHDLAEVDAPSIKKLKTLIHKCENDPAETRRLFAPRSNGSNRLNEALRASLNRFKECVPKKASKRIFLITDNDTPFSASKTEDAQANKICMTLAKDLAETGILIEPFFAKEEDEFNISGFYGSLLQYHMSTEVKDHDGSISNAYHFLGHLDMASWFTKMLRDASMREINKRSVFSIPFKIGEGLEIGVNGFVLISEEKRRGYIWVDPYTATCEEVKVVSEYRDADSTAIVSKHEIVNYFSIGDSKEPKTHRKVVFNKDEVERIRTLGLEKGLFLLGFRPKEELSWAHHLKHSYFIFPNENLFIGSTRAFSALLHSMAMKGKIGYALLRARTSDTPSLVAILPQLEIFDPETSTQEQPPGMHLCILPWADEIHAPGPMAHLDFVQGPEEDSNSHGAIKLAEKIAKKLKVAYAPNNIRNPGLQNHYDFLAAKYLKEDFVEERDQSLPWFAAMQDRCGNLIAQFKEEIDNDPRTEEDPVPAGSSMAKKRRRIEDGEGVDTEAIEAAFADGREKSLLVQQLKEFLIYKKEFKGEGGRCPLKAELIRLVRSVLEKEGKMVGQGGDDGQEDVKVPIASKKKRIII